MWSVGCLFYSIVVGEPPFEQDNIPQTLQAIISGEYSLPPGKFSAAGENFLRYLLNLVLIARSNISDMIHTILIMFFGHIFFERTRRGGPP